MADRVAPGGERPHRQQGVALLTVLLLVAVIATIAGAATQRLRLATRTTATAVSLVSLRAGAMAAETLALVRIDDLLGRDASRVTLAGGWSGRPLPVPLPGGGAGVVRVVDGGNCFNLNGVVVRDGAGAYVANAPAQAALARLIALAGGQDGDRIAAATADWIDSDDVTLPGGAEDAAYLSLPEPYRAADTLMADASEWRAVAGVSAALYARLRPLVCALPMAAPSILNLDTLAPGQAVLLAAWGGDAGAFAAALARRPADGFASAADFWGSVAGGGGAAATHAGVTTTWFELRIDVARGPARLEEHALIDARRLPARLCSRQWGEAG